MRKMGVCLINLGSPDSAEVKDVRKYLNEFLMDERVIDMPYLKRFLLVRGIIVPFRAPKSSAAYKSIWTPEGSPLIINNNNLEKSLSVKIKEPVASCMRYGNPHPKVAFDKLSKENPGLEEVILFPMYPHYAMSSYETAVEYAKKIHLENNYPFKLTIYEPYFDDTHYLDALSKSMEPYLKEEYDRILFSYHGVPERHIRKSDPSGSHCLQVDNCCEADNESVHKFCYRHQTYVTTREIVKKLKIPEGKYEQSFQSRLGRDPWLTPYTANRFSELPSEGVKNLLVVCPAFVSDCLETLEEIAEEGKEIFLKAGGEKFKMIPCLNDQQVWVESIDKMLNKFR